MDIEGIAPAPALADTARATGAHRVIVAQHRSRLRELTRGSVASRLRRLLPDVAVELVRPGDANGLS